MSKFAGAAAYYQTFRPGIPEEVARTLVEAARRDAPATTLLDLGTGTGQVVQALHPYFADIVAVDPDKELLRLAETNLSGVAGLRLVQARAEDFAPAEGWKASLVTICRAFHWMDQDLVLRRLSDQVAPSGVVAVFGDSSFWAADNDWKKAVRAVIQQFLGEERRAGSGTFKHHDKPYSEILAESPFNRVAEIALPVRRTWTRETILGYLYSTSFAARHLFGDQLEDFEAAVTAVLAEYSSDNTYFEDNEFLIRFGRRP
ncbi:SAM-dependent methyltransferase [Actinomadura craniellae]|uniref:SAM-dependent methyltransferase n=1 Tax=Actinomadura craniellae TaxID=2231787 RepID=A0A365HFZ0_9ACTN|nr:class I SAM-dependent methyltransferase [Actinomadura craniellae]RAY17013.1 SAM-dependent methyltransferase [Actinomadura craniellae]